MIPKEKLGVVVESIQAWIKDQVEAAHVKNVVVGLSGGADSALVALLCKKSFPDMVAVVMPCHSSKASAERAYELAKKFNIKTVTVDLSAAHELISRQYLGQSGQAPEKMADAALRSCLRAPTLDFVAKMNNALIVGTGNRDEDEVARYYQKRGDGAVDISPIAKLHKSEVYQLLEYLGCTESIMKAPPSADLWGPDSGQQDEKELGLTYPEIEWAIHETDKSGNIFHGGYVDIQRALQYTPRQWHVLKTLMHMEKISRHKASMPPVFDVRYLFESSGDEEW